MVPTVNFIKGRLLYVGFCYAPDNGINWYRYRTVLGVFCTNSAVQIDNNQFLRTSRNTVGTGTI